MLGMGPLLWRLANLKTWNSERAAQDEPVSRDESRIIADPFVSTPKYRYEYPAAWLYYQMIDSFSERRTGNEP